MSFYHVLNVVEIIFLLRSARDLFIAQNLQFFRIEMNEIFIKILRSSSDTPLNGKPIKIIVTWLVFVSRDVHALLKYTKCTFYKFTMVCNSCIKTTLK